MARTRQRSTQQKVITFAAFLLLAGLWWWTQSDNADTTGTEPENRSGLTWVKLADLPPEAADTMELIDAGGPFPYDRDGITFQNREGILPGQQQGYYREYTVPTPGEDDRGARRIVSGGEEEYYWTEDHYESFERIAR